MTKHYKSTQVHSTINSHNYITPQIYTILLHNYKVLIKNKTRILMQNMGLGMA